VSITTRFKSHLRKLEIKLSIWRLLPAASQRFWRQSKDYESYVVKQLERTMSKRDTKRQHTQIMINKIAELVDISTCDVLCVGCRNTAEIDYFLQKGARQVTGIDLYSTSPEVLVMDMHNMTFPADSFDIVYSTHSLEHSYDIQKVVDEFVRVCKNGGVVMIEVPVKFETNEVDRVDMGSLATLHSKFGEALSEVIWSDTQEPLRPLNTHIMSIIRSIMRIKKF